MSVDVEQLLANMRVEGLARVAAALPATPLYDRLRAQVQLEIQACASPHYNRAMDLLANPANP